MALPNPLWRVVVVQPRQVVPPGERYRWDNRRREGSGQVVVQLVLAGALHMRSAAGDAVIRAGEAALFCHGEQSDYFLVEPRVGNAVFRWCVFTGAGLPEHWDHLRERHGVAAPCALRSPLRRQFDELVDQVPADPFDEALAVQSFVVALYRAFRSRHIEGLGSADRAVEALLAQPYHPWSMKELAARHACSREHLSRVFRQRIGMAPGAWLAQRRLRKALALLRDTDLPVAEIARQCGYGSAHSLARQVRARTGGAPTDLRR